MFSCSFPSTVLNHVPYYLYNLIAVVLCFILYFHLYEEENEASVRPRAVRRPNNADLVSEYFSNNLAI